MEIEPGFYAVKIGPNYIKKIEVIRVIGGRAGEPCYLDCNDGMRELDEFNSLNPARIENPSLTDELKSVFLRLFRLIEL